MLSTAACKQQAQLKLLQSKKLSFPSASAIEYYKGKLFVFGDDAPYALVTDTAFSVQDTIVYLPGRDRIPKYSKPDIEAVLLDSSEGTVSVEAWASGSAANRNMRLRIDAGTNKLIAFDSFAYQPLLEHTKSIGNVNMEGLVRLPQGWLVSNRANLAQPETWLLLWTKNPLNSSPQIKELALGMRAGSGVSALTYHKEKDRLLFVVSEEATTSATADGAIGESWLCWIDDISKKLASKSLKPTQKIQLRDVSESISGQKVEGITLQSHGNDVAIYLCADNDDGVSSFFHLSWSDAGK